MPGVSTSSSGPSQQLMGQYNTEFQAAQQRNDQSYQQILAAFNQQQGQTQQQANQLAGGYSRLGNQVQQTIGGIGRAKSQDIADAFAQQSGQLSQQMVNSGLGNSTVQGSMQRGLTLDSQKAQIALADQIAQLRAGYQSQLGGAGLQAQMQGLGLQAQGTNTLMGAVSSFRTPYPSWPPSTSQSQSSNMDPSRGGANPGGNNGGYRDWSGSNNSPGFNQTSIPGFPEMPQQQMQGGGWDGLYTGNWANQNEFGPNAASNVGNLHQNFWGTPSPVDQQGGYYTPTTPQGTPSSGDGWAGINF